VLVGGPAKVWSWLARALLAVWWLAGGGDGSVAGCTWHIHIVRTADADRYDAPVVHNAQPRAPYVDVTDAVKNLTVTGIRVDAQVNRQHPGA